MKKFSEWIKGKEKIVIIVGVLLLLLIIGIVVYFVFFSSGNKGNGEKMADFKGGKGWVEGDYQTTALNLHNEYRKRHHADPMELDDQLKVLGVQCAEHYAQRGTIDHSCRVKGGAGENLYMGSSSLTATDNDAVVQAIDLWYLENKDYDFSKGKFTSGTGHFTQVVWRTSKQLGMGIAKKGGTTYVVALYKPAGNMMGTFHENVLKA